AGPGCTGPPSPGRAGPAGRQPRPWPRPPDPARRVRPPPRNPHPRWGPRPRRLRRHWLPERWPPPGRPPPQGCAARRWWGPGAACRGSPAPPPSRSLLLILVHDLGVHDVLVLGARVGGGRLLASGPVRGRRLLLGVERLTDLLARLGQLGLGGLDRLDVLALQRGLHLVDGGAHLGRDVLGELVGVVGEQLLRGVGQLFGRVAGVLLLAPLGVLGGVRLGL